ncbi:hypothetical protein V1517DRAFT_353805 [Lipomyces orientalis]|uniref:Uncharacterized protein n=1 Tax=Lipomyces orientalis TaxID=1233043 RepID=A0ACC3TK92_9ASCO
MLHRQFGFSLFSKIPTINVKTWYLCKKVINGGTVLSPIVYDCCPKVSDVIFLGACAEETDCPTCHERCYQPSGSSRQSRKTNARIFAQTELARTIQELSQELTRNCPDEPESVRDRKNGDLLKRLMNHGFKTNTKIALRLSVDGVQKDTYQVWPITGTFMNVPLEIKHLSECGKTVWNVADGFLH